jgi:hypothetical protein
VRIVADKQRLSEGIVEKDYWVTHSLWSLRETGLAIYFKGGTSLSKGFGLTQRFSEDVDLTIDRGDRSDLPELGSLRSDTVGATEKRRAFFEALTPIIDIPSTTETKLLPPTDGRWISVEYHVHYPRLFEVPNNVRPFVRLEPGLRSWKPPVVSRDLTSFLHEHVIEVGLLQQYVDNRPAGMNCVHPFVTMMDKLESVVKRYARAELVPEEFIRHYEDLVHLIASVDEFPPLTSETREEVIVNCLRGREIRPDDAAFVLDDADRRSELQAAYRDIESMFWGTRIPLEDCCKRIAKWLSENPIRQN